MRFSTLAFAAIAVLPSAISAFSLYDISSDLGDANDKCASQYSIPLMSCGFLPGKCSDACQEQLQSLETTLQGVCKDSKKPQNLLLAALNDGLVPALCVNAASSGSSSSSGSDDTPSATPTFMSGPGKTPSSSAAQLTFSGVVEATSATEDQSEPTGLVIDTSVPETTATQTVAYPENTYAPTTLQTSNSPASTTSSSSEGSGNGGSNGSPFSSQDDNPNSGAAVRVSAFGVAIGVFALIANIA
ncbi:uncharacterized protein DFL_004231 [Arthrobotrys flagrans]|uniref:Extracellular membrane protein CFEM domain-containing protein n=1 Tax=Arthrobotrys flagrans TaxID=97331 RepID=A0A437A4B8_ARTFL|nr:hypothetical protein DFL_004231 [Arthrobotrys flagrans]